MTTRRPGGSDGTLRTGSLAHRVLRLLAEAGEPVHGLALCDRTGRPSGTIYPLLRRLEDLGWLAGEWEQQPPDELGRPRRRNYALTEAARKDPALAWPVELSRRNAEAVCENENCERPLTKGCLDDDYGEWRWCDDNCQDAAQSHLIGRDPYY